MAFLGSGLGCKMISEQNQYVGKIIALFQVRLKIARQDFNMFSLYGQNWQTC